MTRRQCILWAGWYLIPVSWLWAGGLREAIAIEAYAAAWYCEEFCAGRVPEVMR